MKRKRHSMEVDDPVWEIGRQQSGLRNPAPLLRELLTAAAYDLHAKRRHEPTTTPATDADDGLFPPEPRPDRLRAAFRGTVFHIWKEPTRCSYRDRDGVRCSNELPLGIQAAIYTDVTRPPLKKTGEHRKEIRCMWHQSLLEHWMDEHPSWRPPCS